MQLRFKTNLTGKQYVSRQAWRNASLERCPIHTHGRCTFARHGTYARVNPPGAQIPRWYCPKAHRTFSLLPDCLAARLSGTLVDIEAVVTHVEQAKSLEVAADQLRPDIELPGAIRWTRRRVKAVVASLTALKGLIPERLVNCQATLAAFRQGLHVDPVLITLREIAASHLACLPPPLGFRPPPVPGGEHPKHTQHPKGPDPPPAMG